MLIPKKIKSTIVGDFYIKCIFFSAADDGQKLEFSEEDEEKDGSIILEAKVNNMLSCLRGRAESMDQDLVEESSSAEIEPEAGSNLKEEVKEIQVLKAEVEENEITPTKHHKKKHVKKLADLRDRLLMSSSRKRRHSGDANEDNSSERQVKNGI